jgi:hypothetical protein
MRKMLIVAFSFALVLSSKSVSGSFVRAAGHEAYVAPCQYVEHHPEPYLHGYLYGSSSYALVDARRNNGDCRGDESRTSHPTVHHIAKDRSGLTS